jgi:hypothetical protein
MIDMTRAGITSTTSAITTVTSDRISRPSA